MVRALLLLSLACLSAAAAAEPAEPRPLAKLEGPSGVAVAFSQDGSRLLTAGKDEACVWDAQTFKPLTEPLKHGGELLIAALNADGTLVLTAGGMEARLWDAATGEGSAVLRQPDGVRFAAFSPDGSAVVTGGADGSARLWGARTGVRRLALDHPRDPHALAPRAVRFAAFAPDGATLLTLGLAGHVVHDDGHYIQGTGYLWDTRTGRRLAERSVEYRAGTASFHRHRPAAFSPDGTRLATIEWGAVAVRPADGGAVLWAQEQGHTVGGTYALAFSPDGTKLVTFVGGGEPARAVRVLDAVSGKHLSTLAANGYPTDVAFSPDGRRILVTADHCRSPFGDLFPAASLYEAETGRLALTIKGPRGVGDAPAAAFSPDGRRVAVGFAADGFTAVYEVPPPPPEEGK